MEKRQIIREEREKLQMEADIKPQQKEKGGKETLPIKEKTQKRQEQMTEKRREQESGSDGCTREEVNADIGRDCPKTSIP